MTPEEAVRHAIGKEMERMHPAMRVNFEGKEAEVAQSILSGQPNELAAALLEAVEVGHPDWVPPKGMKPEDREAHLLYQDQLLARYPGTPWTPEQTKSYTPGPQEMSPGGQMKDGIEERAQLFKDMVGANRGRIASPARHGWFFATSPGAWTGTHNPNLEQQTAAGNYSKGLDRTHAGAYTNLGAAVNNPENWIGSYVTKMGPVLSDGASILASALLDGNPDTKASEAAGDMATRSYGADWNRTYPQLTEDQGWRKNDTLVRDMRQAYRGTEGMSSGDTFRATFGGHVPYIQPLINGAMSFLNGALDGSTLAGSLVSAPIKSAAIQTSKMGVPVLSKYASAVAADISRAGAAARTAQEFGGEALDPLTVAGTAAQFADPAEPETSSQFNARIAQDAARRKDATKALEQNQEAIRRPQSLYQTYLAEPVGKVIGNAVGGFMR